MVSEIEKEFKKIDGVIHIVPKEYPDWYGIEGVGFIWHNEWGDPEIEYKGRRCSCFIVGDTMWERWIHDDPERERDIEGFENYMKNNADEVKELCELALFGKENYDTSGVLGT